jgi:hypothetical protein
LSEFFQSPVLFEFDSRDRAFSCFEGFVIVDDLNSAIFHVMQELALIRLRTEVEILFA